MPPMTCVTTCWKLEPTYCCYCCNGSGTPKRGPYHHHHHDRNWRHWIILAFVWGGTQKTAFHSEDKGGRLAGWLGGCLLAWANSCVFRLYVLCVCVCVCVFEVVGGKELEFLTAVL
ncbi:hypothetical protein VTJ04DRAFT_500 [Mycothermus thermophilus]|uniref:uncharacterized protein n=1 Tax=Humicola insolens TaxID=85995 RepID=UPI003743E760